MGARSASLFLASGAGDELIGLVSEWDWTRTSFAATVSHWPTVARALDTGSLQTISKEEALGAEAEWFGPRGIVSTVCVPLRTSDRRIGVLFFDFDTSIDKRAADYRLLGDVGNRCARAIARRPRIRPQQRELLAS